LALCFVAAVAQAYNVDWENLKSMDITPPQYQHLFQEVSSGRIVGGQEATPGQFPYQVGLFINVTGGQAFCGGSILSEEWILTAAHCVDATKYAVVVIGGHNVRVPDAEQIRVEATEFIVHEKWDATAITDDVALIRLSRPIEFNDRVQPTRLPAREHSEKNFAGETGTASGWGLPSDSATSISPVLRWVQNRITTHSGCSQWYFGIVQSAMHICMSGSGGRSICSGDSGGPMVVTDRDGQPTQVGIVSFGIALGCEFGFPGVFSRVTSYVDWISEKTGIPIPDSI